MKLGLVTDSLADRSLAEAAAVCRGLGLEQVELGCGNWSPAPHVDLKRLTADAGARHRLLDTLGENGLTISALNCSGNPLFPGRREPETGRWRRARSSWRSSWGWRPW